MRALVTLLFVVVIDAGCAVPVPSLGAPCDEGGGGCASGYTCTESLLCVPAIGVVDAGTEDAGADDAGDVDAGDVDAGDADAGGVDAGDVDAGPSPFTRAPRPWSITVILELDDFADFSVDASDADTPRQDLTFALVPTSDATITLDADGTGHIQDPPADATFAFTVKDPEGNERTGEIVVDVIDTSGMEVMLTSGSYNTSGNWASGVVPDLQDVVFIPRGKTATINDEVEAGTIIIANGGVFDAEVQTLSAHSARIGGALIGDASTVLDIIGPGSFIVGNLPRTKCNSATRVDGPVIAVGLDLDEQLDVQSSVVVTGNLATGTAAGRISQQDHVFLVEGNATFHGARPNFAGGELVVRENFTTSDTVDPFVARGTHTTSIEPIGAALSTIAIHDAVANDFQDLVIAGDVLVATGATVDGVTRVLPGASLTGPAFATHDIDVPAGTTVAFDALELAGSVFSALGQWTVGRLSIVGPNTVPDGVPLVDVDLVGSAAVVADDDILVTGRLLATVAAPLAVGDAAVTVETLEVHSAGLTMETPSGTLTVTGAASFVDATATVGTCTAGTVVFRGATVLWETLSTPDVVYGSGTHRWVFEETTTLDVGQGRAIAGNVTVTVDGALTVNGIIDVTRELVVLGELIVPVGSSIFAGELVLGDAAVINCAGGELTPDTCTGAQCPQVCTP